MSTEERESQRCDHLDVLEEAVTLGRTVQVRTRDGRTFEDRVRDVSTEGGRDWAVFAEHGRIPVDDLAEVRRGASAR